MERVFLTFMFLAGAASAQARWQESDCRPLTLPAQDLARISTAAKAVVQTPLDPHSMGSCRQRQQDWFTASFDTVRVPQTDGSERWQSLTCRSDFRRQAPWKCEKWADVRAIHVSVPTTARSIQVAIPDGLDVVLARQYVSQAFSLLAQPGGLPYCSYVEGKKSPPALQATTTQSRAFSELREYMGEGDGELELRLDPEGFAISHDLLYVYFFFAPPEGAARAQCWEHEEIVVTS